MDHAQIEPWTKHTHKCALESIAPCQHWYCVIFNQLCDHWLVPWPTASQIRIWAVIHCHVSLLLPTTTTSPLHCCSRHPTRHVTTSQGEYPPPPWFPSPHSLTTKPVAGNCHVTNVNHCDNGCERRIRQQRQQRIRRQQAGQWAEEETGCPQVSHTLYRPPHHSPHCLLAAPWCATSPMTLSSPAAPALVATSALPSPPPSQLPRWHHCSAPKKPFCTLSKTHQHPFKTIPVPFRQLAPFQIQPAPSQKPTPIIWTPHTLSKNHQHRQINNPRPFETPPSRRKLPPIWQPPPSKANHPFDNSSAFKNKHAPFQKPTPVSSGVGAAYSQNRWAQILSPSPIFLHFPLT